MDEFSEALALGRQAENPQTEEEDQLFELLPDVLSFAPAQDDGRRLLYINKDLVDDVIDAALAGDHLAVRRLQDRIEQNAQQL